MKSEKGQSMVEFALIIPIFILLLFSILDFGRVFHAYLTIDHAGREAARAVSIGEDSGTAEMIAVNNASSINLTVDHVNIPSGSNTSGSQVTVAITYPISFLTPIISSITGPINLTNTTVMRIE